MSRKSYEILTRRSTPVAHTASCILFYTDTYVTDTNMDSSKNQSVWLNQATRRIAKATL